MNKQLRGAELSEANCRCLASWVAIGADSGWSGLLWYFDKPQTIKDFYENEEWFTIIKKVADTLHKDRVIDWQKRFSQGKNMYVD